MVSLLSRLLLILASLSAYAQSTADAPAEQASPVAVIVFVVLFVGSCVAYIAYVWWNARKKKDEH